MSTEPSYTDLRTVVDWFIRQMPMHTRHLLMAELPVQYKLLYPDASPTIIADHVTRRLEALEAQTRMSAPLSETCGPDRSHLRAST